MPTKPPLSETLHAFDRHAEGYGGWEGHPTAQSWRARAIAHCIDRLPQGARVLDVGGGTGVDAGILSALEYRVVILEPSAGMGEVARGRGATVVAGGAADLEGMPDLGVFDGALSNFGALNCVADLTAFGRGLHARLRPGAPAVLVVMGPFALPEALVLLSRGRWKTLLARRRAVVPLGPGQVGVTWWTARKLASALPGFRLEYVEALGALQPPPDLHPGSPRLLRWDARLGRAPVVRHVGDHTLCVFRRLPERTGPM